VLGNPNSVKVVQNGAFDINFLLTRCGIEVRGPIEDTMIAHHIQYPELQKGLGFLGSIYCGSQAYWKDMIKFENIKEES
jgi:DNA polymerase I-like protein with 3'-5' exonuclease and polymerase domains